MTTLAGIDVSNIQGASFDWTPWRGKIGFAFIKISEGTGFADPDAARNMAQARELGIIRGGYHYLHPAESAAAQAAYFIKLAKAAGLGPGDLVMADLETTDGLDDAGVSACAGEFAVAVRDELGAWPVSYTTQSFAEGGYCNSLGLTPAFLADPSHVGLPSPIGPWHLVSFEQLGQRGVDADAFYGDAAELGKLAVPQPRPAPAPAKPPLVTQAQAKDALSALIASAARLAVYVSEG